MHRFVLIGAILAGTELIGTAGGAGVTLAESVEIGPVWAGHPVAFCLLTAGQRQYVAYYDVQRRMTVAARTLGRPQWEYQSLPSRVGWDSHNSLVMAVDHHGCLHLSGNMHCVPLLYFRSEEPHRISMLRRVDGMIGTEEDRCTYPRFYQGPNRELIFTYRIGRSGDGQQIFNIYDAPSKRWRRLLETPLLDGQGAMNAYLSGLVRGPDGRWHVCWMWRDTPDCATNHDISYARSSDLVHWESAAGLPLCLPITLDTGGVIVDPVPAGQGAINIGHCVGFDADGRPIVTYHKYDAAGKSQVFNTRWEGDHWEVYQTSGWDYRWQFGGGGTIVGEVSAGPVRPLADHSLAQDYHHVKHGSGTWRLDAATLRPAGKLSRRSSIPRQLARLESTFPGMQVRTASDHSDSGGGRVRYILRWETLPPNRDRPREDLLPEPSMLRVYKLVAEETSPTEGMREE